MDGQLFASGHGEHRADCHQLDDGRERLTKVHAGTMIEAADDPTSFVTLKGAIGS